MNNDGTITKQANLAQIVDVEANLGKRDILEVLSRNVFGNPFKELSRVGDVVLPCVKLFVEVHECT